MSPNVSRRQVLGMAGAGVAGVALGATGAAAAGAVSSDGDGSDGVAGSYPYYGEHQAGIVTPAQDRLHFAAFDLTTTRASEVSGLLRAWSAAAARMTAGLDAGTYGAVGGPYDAPPDDTGEALGLPPSGLTLTFGFGPGLFVDATGKDRYGFAAQRPEALVDLPHFPADNLDPARSGGDLCVQACAHDPQVAVHAIRNLARVAFGVAAVRWSQLGFGRTSSTSQSQTTPRNLFGFKDGTRNIKAEETDALRDHVWVQGGDGPAWMDGGSYLVARRIRMSIETWDRTSLREQEGIVGRTKGDGAPLSGGGEFSEPDFEMEGSGGPIIPIASHVRLAHPDFNDGARLLRRGYNFVDGSDGLGRLEAGLFFLAYQRDIRTHFIPVQTQLARLDTMNEYLQHVASAVFAIPPGAPAEGSFVGETLLG